jgi:hypothetical protein
LSEYEDFLAAGQTSERWLTATRVFQRDVRLYLLRKQGVEPADSRTPAGLAASVSATVPPDPIAAGQPIDVDVTVTNTGTATWLPAEAEYGGVTLGAHLYDAAGPLIEFAYASAPLVRPSRAIAPGELIRLHVSLPPLAAGRYRLELDCVASRVAWFAQGGSRTASIELRIVDHNSPTTAT